MDRAKLANEYYAGGYSCAQAVACAFEDVIGLPAERVAGLLSGFGGGFRSGEVCGVISGAAMVLGARWPHSRMDDKEAKERAAGKMGEFNRRFLERFPSMRCADLKGLPAAPEKSPAARRLGVGKACGVYVAAAAEILEDMLADPA